MKSSLLSRPPFQQRLLRPLPLIGFFILLCLGLATPAAGQGVPDLVPDLFVRSVTILGTNPNEADDSVYSFFPGDPITIRVSYGRIGDPDNENDDQPFRVELYLTTDNRIGSGNETDLLGDDALNLDNFLLDTITDRGIHRPARVTFDEEGAWLPAVDDEGNEITDEDDNPVFELNDDPDAKGLWYATVAMPENFTGTYYLRAIIRRTGGPDDPFLPNNAPLQRTARVRILPSEGITVSRVSEGLDETQGNELSESPSISRDGRFVAYHTESSTMGAPGADPLDENPLGRSQVLFRDLQLGTQQVISARAGIVGNNHSRHPFVSPDGRMVVFESTANNLVLNDTNQFSDIFMYDRDTALVRRVNLREPDQPNILLRQANAGSFRPVASANLGTQANPEYIVVFESRATNLIPGTAVTNGAVNLFAVNTASGAVQWVNTSVNGIGGNAGAFEPAISDNGRYVVFRSTATNLVPGLSNGLSQIFLKDLVTGEISLVSRGFGQAGSPVANSDAMQPSISADGRVLAFASASSNLVASPDNSGRVRQVYRVDRDRDNLGVFDQPGNVLIEMVSVNFDGTLAGFDTSLDPMLSEDGRFVGYRTLAWNLQQDTITRSDGTRFRVGSLGFHPTEPPEVDAEGVVQGHPIVGFTQLSPFSEVYIRDMGRAVTNIEVTSPGSGYTSSPEVTIVGGGGSGATARAVIDTGTGELVQIDVINPGSGYTTPPTVEISGGGGSGATAIAEVWRHSDRVSVNSFNQETLHRDPTPRNPGVRSQFAASSRSIAMSGDGRFFVFVHDGNALDSIVLGKSNLREIDTNQKRDVFLVDRKFSGLIPTPLGSLPSVTLTTSGADATFGSNRPIVVNAFDPTDIAPDGSEVPGTIVLLEIFANGVPLAQSNPNTTSATLNTLWTAPGTAQRVALYAIATDANGNRGFSNTVFVDVVPSTSLPPIVSVAASPTAFQLGQSTLLTAAAADPDGDIVSVSFFSNGVLLNVDEDPPYEYLYTPSAPGSYSIVAMATDNTGNQVVSGEFPVTVTPPPSPTVTLVQPDSDLTTTVGSPVFFEVIASTLSPGASISTVTIRAQRGAETLTLGAAARVGTTNVYRLSWSPGPGDVGVSAVYAEATDTRGTTGQSTPRINLTINPVIGQPPAVSLISPQPPPGQAGVTTETTETIEFSIQATDADGTIVSVDLIANGGFVGSAVQDPTNPDLYRLEVEADELEAGVFSVVALAIDDDGNRTTSTPLLLTIVNPIPQVELMRPADESLTGTVGQPLFLEARALTGSLNTFIESLVFEANGQVIGTGVRIPGTNRYRFEWVPPLPGSFNISATATDNTGSSFATAQRRVVIREQIGAAPVVTIVEPAADEATVPANLNITFVAQAVDSDGTVDTVEFFIRGGSIGLAERLQGTNRWQIQFNFSEFGVGVYEVVAVARDSNGNTAASAPLDVTVTPSTGAPPVIGDPPLVFLEISPDIDSMPLRSSVFLTALTAPGDGEVVLIRFFADGALVGETEPDAPYVVWTPTRGGNRILTAQAVDNLGNEVLSEPVEFFVSPPVGNLPTVKIVDPLPGSVFPLDLAFTISASVSIPGNVGIVSVGFFGNGFLVDEDDTAPYTGEFFGISSGDSDIHVMVVDTFGNRIISDPITITLTNFSPVGDDRQFIINSISSLFGRIASPIELESFLGQLREGALTRPGLLRDLLDRDEARELLLTTRAYKLILDELPTPVQLDAGATILRENGIVDGMEQLALNLFLTDTYTFKYGLFTERTNDQVFRALFRNRFDGREPNAQQRNEANTHMNAVGQVEYTALFIRGEPSPANPLAPLVSNPPNVSITDEVETILLYTLLTDKRLTRPELAELMALPSFDARMEGIFASPNYLDRFQVTVPPGIFTGVLRRNPETGAFSVFTRENNTAVFLGFDTETSQALFDFNLEIGSNGTFQTPLHNGAQIKGSFSPNQVGGTIQPGMVEFFAGISPAFGLRESFSGFYQGVVLQNASGEVYATLDARGNLFLLTIDGDYQDAVVTQINNAGAFDAVSFRGARFTGTVDGEDGSIDGSYERIGMALREFFMVREGRVGEEFLANISTRGRVGTGAEVMIAGLVIQGSGPRWVLLNGIGPSLPSALENRLSDPVLRLYSGSTLLTSNDDWVNSPAYSAIQEIPFAPKHPKEAALLVELNPGAYTVHLATGDGTPGIGLVEAYDISSILDGEMGSRMVNLSTRGHVGAGPEVLIGGFVISGEVPKKVLIRAAGPSLTALGVPNALQNPALRLYRDSTMIGSNNNWVDSPNRDAIAATPFAPADDREAALLVWLEPGIYTTHVFSENGTTGIGRVEIFEVD
ncbi:MAG: hypothetical protein EA425_14010 [Puniceicoccaceae bacterium]|nr:MAG: hypothetical protein EA425_14010 [Puniceicoccaceae bacterium]